MTLNLPLGRSFATVNGVRVASTTRAIALTPDRPAGVPADYPACSPVPCERKGGGPSRLLFERPCGGGSAETFYVPSRITTLAELVPGTKAIVEVAPPHWAIGIVESAITDGNEADGVNEERKEETGK
jgi:hypothetical protein